EELANDYLHKNSLIKNESYVLCLEGFSELATALSTRILMLAFQNYAKEKDGQLERKHIEALLQLIKKGRSGSTLNLPGVRAEYAYGFLTICRREQAKAQESFSAVLPVPGQLKLPDGRLLSAEVVTGEEPVLARNQTVYPRNLVAGIIEVRNRKNGDRFRTKNGYAKKLKEYLIDKKLPQAERDKLLLVCDGSDVLWLIGEQAAGWKADTAFQEWLLFTLTEGGQ
ncbi:MAG: tRNA lysidine(34) synthetase TilS, partial [Acidaminococcaceae bacterium]|nr:tRNA lysidine(34) synthetase TilS [Acidaminococcaceae bacterium]